jgi:hypothetical protein
MSGFEVIFVWHSTQINFGVDLQVKMRVLVAETRASP